MPSILDKMEELNYHIDKRGMCNGIATSLLIRSIVDGDNFEENHSTLIKYMDNPESDEFSALSEDKKKQLNWDLMAFFDEVVLFQQSGIESIIPLTNEKEKDKKEFYQNFKGFIKNRQDGIYYANLTGNKIKVEKTDQYLILVDKDNTQQTVRILKNYLDNDKRMTIATSGHIMSLFPIGNKKFCFIDHDQITIDESLDKILNTVLNRAQSGNEEFAINICCYKKEDVNLRRSSTKYEDDNQASLQGKVQSNFIKLAFMENYTAPIEAFVKEVLAFDFKVAEEIIESFKKLNNSSDSFANGDNLNLTLSKLEEDLKQDKIKSDLIKIAFMNNYTAPIEAFVKEVLASKLNVKDKKELLLAKDANGNPSILMAFHYGHTALIEAFVKEVLAFDLKIAEEIIESFKKLNQSSNSFANGDNLNLTLSKLEEDLKKQKQLKRRIYRNIANKGQGNSAYNAYALGLGYYLAFDLNNNLEQRDGIISRLKLSKENEEEFKKFLDPKQINTKSGQERIQMLLSKNLRKLATDSLVSKLNQDPMETYIHSPIQWKMQELLYNKSGLLDINNNIDIKSGCKEFLKPDDNDCKSDESLKIPNLDELLLDFCYWENIDGTINDIVAKNNESELITFILDNELLQLNDVESLKSRNLDINSLKKHVMDMFMCNSAARFIQESSGIFGEYFNNDEAPVSEKQISELHSYITNEQRKTDSNDQAQYARDYDLDLIFTINNKISYKDTRKEGVRLGYKSNKHSWVTVVNENHLKALWNNSHINCVEQLVTDLQNLEEGDRFQSLKYFNFTTPLFGETGLIKDQYNFNEVLSILPKGDRFQFLENHKQYIFVVYIVCYQKRMKVMIVLILYKYIESLFFLREFPQVKAKQISFFTVMMKTLLKK